MCVGGGGAGGGQGGGRGATPNKVEGITQTQMRISFAGSLK